MDKADQKIAERILLYERVKGLPWRQAEAALAQSEPKPTLARVRWAEKDVDG